MLSDNGTYGHKETCSNCSHLNMYRIPKGTTISSYLSNKTCTNCGCMVRKSDYGHPGGYQDPNIRYVMGAGTTMPKGTTYGAGV